MSFVGVFSAKGGVGKTTLTANIGSSLVSEFSKTVCLVDGNLTAANLGLHFGLYFSPLTLHDVLDRRTPINTAIYIHPSGVRILPSPISAEKIFTSTKSLRSQLRKLNGYDHVILDTPPTLGAGTIQSFDAVDQALIVSTPDPAAITDAAKMAIHAEKWGLEVLGLVVNRVANKKYELSDDEMKSIAGIEILGKIPEQEDVRKSLSEGVPEVLKNPYSKFSIEVNKLVAEIFGLRYKPPSIIDRITSFAGFNRLGRKRDEERDYERSQRLVIPRDEYRNAPRMERKHAKRQADWEAPEALEAPEAVIEEKISGDAKEQLKSEIIGMLRDSIKTQVASKMRKRRSG